MLLLRLLSFVYLIGSYTYGAAVHHHASVVIPSSTAHVGPLRTACKSLLAYLEQVSSLSLCERVRSSS